MKKHTWLLKEKRTAISKLFSKLFSGDNFLLERRWRGAASMIYADRECDTMDSREDLSHSFEKICPSPSLNIRKIIVLSWNSQINFLKKSLDKKEFLNPFFYISFLSIFLISFHTHLASSKLIDFLPRVA
jgi:hypothetical protein